MPFTTDFRESGIIWNFSGTVTFRDLLDTNATAWGHENWPKFRFQIIDFSGIEGFLVDPSDGLAMARIDTVAAKSEPNMSMRVAIVATRPDVLEAAQSYLDWLEVPSWETRICSTAEEAMNWACTHQ
ncbi:hypothetical protein [Gimibacter soli]|uniref:Uncharacterized protein n=1 Tax=Gimibacter soli TaxID=3024400 RepID=A0AAE9XUD3_9PROT|nr:hypothetical protein [Gimibacter soli]WCL54695.1 hypothetical protein PH603_02835 [Gimibacter soli]